MSDATLSPNQPEPAPGASEALWSKWVHDKLIETTLSKYCGSIQDLLKRSSLNADAAHNGDGVEDVLLHGMWPYPAIQDSSVIVAMIDQRLEARMQLAEAAVRTGNWNEAIWQLGKALHTISDRLSPPHVSANGIPRKWPIPLGERNEHTRFLPWAGKETWNQMTGPILAQITAQYNTAMERVIFAGQATSNYMPTCRSPVWTGSSR